MTAMNNEFEKKGKQSESKELTHKKGHTHPTAMIRAFGWTSRAISRLLFDHVFIDSKDLNELQTQGAETVVYVMQSRSLLDYLFFNWLFLEYHIPLVAFSNGLRIRFFRRTFARLVLWLGSLFSDQNLVRKKRGEEKRRAFSALISQQKPTFLFLGKAKQNKASQSEFIQPFLFSIVNEEKRGTQKIKIIPLVIVWERRPDKPHNTIVEEVFGTVQAPGFWRKFLYWFRTIWQSFLKFGQPVARVCEPIFVQESIEDLPSATTADVAQLLERDILSRIREERHVILGPPAKDTLQIWKQICLKPHMVRIFLELAEQKNKTEEQIRNEAELYFKEISAEPNLMALKILSSVFSLIWYRLYDGLEIDLEGLEKVREASKNSSIVLIPSHKSHMDYLIITYIFYHYGLTPPLIAAGVNLNFWPLGFIFRKAGAFFIRRSFKDAPLYRAVFREYLNVVLEMRYPVEFFIEGTRSRTGKLVKPRYGMLEMIVSGLGAERSGAIKLIPISVGYEHVIESQAHKKEQLGAEKTKEGFGALLKTPKFLSRKYGRIYIEFNEAIDLSTYLDNCVYDKDEDLRALLVRLGHRITHDINAVTPVTPSALCALILLSHRGDSIGRAELLADIGFALHFLKEKHRSLRISRTIREALDEKRETLERLEKEHSGERNPMIESILGRAVSPLIDTALERFRQSDLISIEEKKDEKENTFVVPTDARLELAYAKNSIVHHFIPEALLSTAIRSFGSTRIRVSELMEETLFLSKMFKYEWIYAERSAFETVFSMTLSYFISRSWVSLDGDDSTDLPHNFSSETHDIIQIRTPFPTELSFFRTQVLNFVEAYDVVVDTLLRSDLELEKKILKEALRSAGEKLQSGDLLFHETLSKPTYKNALRLLKDWEIISFFHSSKNDRVVKLLDIAALDEIDKRLKRFRWEEKVEIPKQISADSTMDIVSPRQGD